MATLCIHIGLAHCRSSMPQTSVQCGVQPSPCLQPHSRGLSSSWIGCSVWPQTYPAWQVAHVPQEHLVLAEFSTCPAPWAEWLTSFIYLLQRACATKGSPQIQSCLIYSWGTGAHRHWGETEGTSHTLSQCPGVPGSFQLQKNGIPHPVMAQKKRQQFTLCWEVTGHGVSRQVLRFQNSWSSLATCSTSSYINIYSSCPSLL